MYSNNFNILSQTSVTWVFSPKFILFWPKIHFFGWLKKKKSVKCLSKFLFKDSCRIRTTGSHNCSLILFKYISSSLKKNNQRKWIFWHTHWISFCSKHCHKLLAKIMMEWSWKPKTTNFFLKNEALYLMWLCCIISFCLNTENLFFC